MCWCGLTGLVANWCPNTHRACTHGRAKQPCFGLTSRPDCLQSLGMPGWPGPASQPVPEAQRAPMQAPPWAGMRPRALELLEQVKAPMVPCGRRELRASYAVRPAAAAAAPLQRKSSQGMHRGGEQQQQPHNSPNVEGCSAVQFTQEPQGQQRHRKEAWAAACMHRSLHQRDIWGRHSGIRTGPTAGVALRFSTKAAAVHSRLTWDLQEADTTAESKHGMLARHRIHTTVV